MLRWKPQRSKGRYSVAIRAHYMVDPILMTLRLVVVPYEVIPEGQENFSSDFYLLSFQERLNFRLKMISNLSL